MSYYHTVELGLTCIGILALVIWWELICRLGVPDRFHHFYVGVLVVLLAWAWGNEPGTLILQCIGTLIMSDCTYMMYRRVRQDEETRTKNPYATRVCCGLLWAWNKITRHRSTSTSIGMYL